jgi:hypothetical protein
LNDRSFIEVCHDESSQEAVFNKKKSWASVSNPTLPHKSSGTPIMVSGFITEVTGGFVTLSDGSATFTLFESGHVFAFI